MALVGLATVITAKKEFVLLTLWNFLALLGPIIVSAVIIPLSRTRRRAFVAIVLGVAFLAVSAESAGLQAIGDRVDDRTVAAVQAPGQAFDRLVTLALGGHADHRIEQAKEHQRALYAIPDRFVKTIGSATVHVDPDETSAVWAYDFAWRPAPIFQTYAAYTPALDDLNSETLSDSPQFVLSRLSPTAPATSTILGRLGVQESPRYSRTLLCDYTVSGVQDRWALFNHSGPHCGALTALSQIPVRGDDVITVPAPSRPGMAVLVGIDLQRTILDRLFQGTVVPLSISTVMLDGVAYRLVAANAAEPFLVTSPASVDGTNLQIHAHTIGVGRSPSLGQGGVTARLRFYEMRVQP